MQHQLADLAALIGFPPEAALEFGDEMSFKFIVKRRRADSLITYALVFAGLDERYLLGREDWVTEEKYRRAIAAFEAEVLPNRLVNSPIVITLEEWRSYERGGRQGGTHP